MHAFTLRIEEGHNGLFCVTSPEIKGLFAAEETLADALMAASQLIAALGKDGARAGAAREPSSEAGVPARA